VPYTVGLTGSPGAGKSTLTDQLIGLARAGWPEPLDREVSQVGVLAIDPTSPFSGGAILGDRVRMGRHALDTTVYIRSMATRGHLGGLALAVPDAVRVLGAATLPLVFVETVGVGQMEVDIASAADTTVVVVTPGWGDSMQAAKAGLLEVADLFVINKADRPGAREARRDLDQMLDLSPPGSWRPSIIDTTATTGDGVAELWSAVAAHRVHLESTGTLATRRADRLTHELRRVLLARCTARIDEVARREEFTSAVKALAAGEVDPYQAADRLLEL
jgi:LAO/AO transport system kinase